MKRTLGILALILMAIVGIAPAATATTPTNVVIEDTAGVLYQPQLLPALEKISFHEPTKVAVYTRNGMSSDNFNEEVLRYARANHPEWISADGQKWADGLFIFAFDPVGRQVGTYMGEDRKVTLQKREAIQDAASKLFTEAQWTDGTIAGVKKGASLINQPWYLSLGFIITASIVGGIAILGFGARAVIRANNRKKATEHLKRGDAAYSSVSLDLDVTELNAKTIPESSSYGTLVLEKYRNFSTRYHEAGALNQQSHDFTKKELSKATNVKRVGQYADLAEELDDLDDVIADTNTLLNRFSGWEGAWDRQAQTLVEDLAQLPGLIAQPEAQGMPTTGALASLHTQRIQGLQQLAADFHAGLISPETALDNLKEIRDELTALLQQHAELMIGKYAKTSAEKTDMRKTMDRNRRHDAQLGRATILGSVYGWNMFYSVHSFNAGYSTARQQVDTSRSNAGSGGSNSGYGSSGGSFSGSGSSSSF
ncbi:DUF5129 domain-containing protein [Arthrobacter sp. H35-D1]|uniref:DUF5129 domain-containing protein n=1 Tax=Arthrobacter sp. H35-D1 TaxID=3046202 RepID=UPI0024B9A7FE|nr:DUF5129 domain-containing protein [Arthrobacter sp. H35-D1]MDJ0312682.1 DUF5129 domain-containing protein [Arthrobacter sp. H35-D1]